MNRTLAYTSSCVIGLVPVSSALALEEETSSVDNFVQSADLETVALGSLGQIVTRGDGPEHLVLVTDHDWDWSIWESFMERNGDRYTMHAVTPAGVGDTPPPPMPDDYAGSLVEIPWYNGYIEGVETLIRQKGLDKPTLVGFRDSGSYAAFRVALDNPGLVGGIITVSGGPRAFFGGPPPVLETPTDADARLAYISENFLPFAKTVAGESWSRGGLNPLEFSVDAERSQALAALQRTGRPETHIRYRMELFTTNAAPYLPSIQVPILAIIASYDFDEVLEDASRRFADQLGGEEAAMDALINQWVGAFGSEEAARDEIVRWFRKSTVEWDEIDEESVGVQIERVAGSRLFIMLDQPGQFDTLVADFINKSN